MKLIIVFLAIGVAYVAAQVATTTKATTTVKTTPTTTKTTPTTTKTTPTTTKAPPTTTTTKATTTPGTTKATTKAATTAAPGRAQKEAAALVVYIRFALANSMNATKLETLRVFNLLVNQIEAFRTTAVTAAQFSGDSNLAQNINNSLNDALSKLRDRISEQNMKDAFDKGDGFVQMAMNEVTKKINDAPISAKLDACWDTNKATVNASVNAILNQINGLVANESKPVFDLAEKARTDIATAVTEVAAGFKKCQADKTSPKVCAASFLKAYMVMCQPKMDQNSKDLDSAFNTMKGNLQGKAFDLLGKVFTTIQDISNLFDTCLKS